MVVAVAHDALLIDHDHGALGAQAGRERAVGPRDLSANIGQQRDRERVLRAAPLVRCQVLRGDADTTSPSGRSCSRSMANTSSASPSACATGSCTSPDTSPATPAASPCTSLPTLGGCDPVSVQARAGAPLPRLSRAGPDDNDRSGGGACGCAKTATGSRHPAQKEPRPRRFSSQRRAHTDTQRTRHHASVTDESRLGWRRTHRPSPP